MKHPTSESHYLTEVVEIPSKRTPINTGDRLLTRSYSLAWVATLGLYLATQLLLPSFPLFVEEITGNARYAGGLNSLYLVAAGAGTVFVPWVVRRVGRRWSFLLGIAGYATVVLYPIANGTEALAAITVIRGLGFGLSNATLLTIVVDAVPTSRRGEGLGYYQLAVSLGGVSGSGTGVFLWQHYGFTAAVTPATIMMLIAAMCVLLMDQILGPARNRTANRFMTVFRRNRQLRRPAAAFATLTFSYGVVMTYAGIYIFSYELGSAALFFLVVMSSQVIVRPLSGWLCDRVGGRNVFLASASAASIGMLGMALTSTSTGVMLAGVLNGMGFGGGVIASQVILMFRLPPDDRPMASAMFGAAYSWGMGIGAALFGAVLMVSDFRAAFFMTFSVLVTGTIIGSFAPASRPADPLSVPPIRVDTPNDHETD